MCLVDGYLIRLMNHPKISFFDPLSNETKLTSWYFFSDDFGIGPFLAPTEEKVHSDEK